MRLSRRDHSEAELRRALKRAGHEDALIDEAVLRLRRERALDDARYATAFARSRRALAGLGRARIRSELRGRGVSREDVEAGLAGASLEIGEAEALDRTARRLLRHGGHEPAERRLRRVFAALLRRGFAPSLVRRRLAVLEPAWRDMLEAPRFELDDSLVQEEPGAAPARGRRRMGGDES